MTSFIYKPRTGNEMLKASPKGTKIYLYSDLCRDPRPAIDVLASLGRNSIILYQDPNRMNSGHWTSLSIHPETKEIYFFSSYGGMPDREKMSWVSRDKLLLSGQIRNVINDGLKEFAKRGWTVYYNDYPFQTVGDDTATCGIWTAAFLNSGINPDDFAANHHSLQQYYSKYFN